MPHPYLEQAREARVMNEADVEKRRAVAAAVEEAERELAHVQVSPPIRVTVAAPTTRFS
jgi:hypothetical protein